MLFSGVGAAAPATPPETLCAIAGHPRRKRIQKPVAKAKANTSEAAISANFGHQGPLIGRSAPVDACFHFLRLSFSGRCGLPRVSLYRLTKCNLSPCFTSHSPKLCK